MRLAKPTIDIGLFSDNPAMPEFYGSTLGLPRGDVLPHSPTYSEIFFTLGECSLKINHSTEPMASGSSGYVGLWIARRGATEVQRWSDPDGLEISVVPVGHRGITTVGIDCRVADVAGERSFLVDAIGAQPVGASGLRIGDAVLFLTEGDAPPPTPTWRRGLNYYVLFVEDCVAAHEELVRAGGVRSVDPVRLADRCVFSWTRTPSGNWIELVQYAELSGPLPPLRQAADCWGEIERWREDAVPF